MYMRPDLHSNGVAYPSRNVITWFPQQDEICHHMYCGTILSDKESEWYCLQHNKHSHASALIEVCHIAHFLESYERHAMHGLHMALLVGPS